MGCIFFEVVSPSWWRPPQERASYVVVKETMSQAEEATGAKCVW
jgi:hypothetical protein